MKRMVMIVIGLLLIGVINGSTSFITDTIKKQEANGEERVNIDPDIAKEIQNLRSSDPVKRGNAAIALGRMGPRAIPAIPALIERLDDTIALQKAGIMPLIGNTAEEAAKALINMGKPGIESLIGVLKNKNSYIVKRMIAAEGLGHSNDPLVIEALISVLKDTSERTFQTFIWGNTCVRFEAAKSLGRIKGPRARDALIEALTDEEIRIRRDAASALGKIGDEVTKEALLKAALGDRHIRNISVDYVKNKQIVDLLLIDLKNEKSSIRAEAAEALGKTKDINSIEPLIEALKDKDFLVTWKAGGALQTIKGAGGDSLGEDPEKWQKWWEQNKDRLLKKSQ
jgi:HEAT repeat protein